MKIKLIKLNVVCLRLPLEHSKEVTYLNKKGNSKKPQGVLTALRLPSEYIKEVAHLNRKGSLQKKPIGVF